MPVLLDHLRRHVDPAPNALVCTAPNGGRINLSNFNRDVWKPARSQALPAGSPLRKVRRHDLRHSAITAWLNAGVLLKTAQQWSGHRQMSVLSDTYLGVTMGGAAVSLRRVEEALDDALTETCDGNEPGEGELPSQNHRKTEGEPGQTAASDGDR